jgi:transcriptional regulator with XRE-family HTH domain
VSHFSSQLRVILERRGLNQTALCEKSGVSQGALSRYLSGSSPRRSAVEKICSALRHQADRSDLIAAHALDLLPASLREKFTIRPKRARGREQRQRKNDPRRAMPAELLRAYDQLGAAAIEHDAIADLVIKLSAVIPRK